jgi:hypothetical protein
MNPSPEIFEIRSKKSILIVSFILLSMGIWVLAMFIIAISNNALPSTAFMPFLLVIYILALSFKMFNDSSRVITITDKFITFRSFFVW